MVEMSLLDILTGGLIDGSGRYVMCDQQLFVLSKLVMVYFHNSFYRFSDHQLCGLIKTVSRTDILVDQIIGDAHHFRNRRVWLGADRIKQSTDEKTDIAIYVSNMYVVTAKDIINAVLGKQ